MDQNQNAFKFYLLHEKKYSLHTINAYNRDIDNFASFLTSEHQENDFTKVTYNHIRGWIVSLVNNGVKPISVNRKISALKTFYRFLIKSKQIQYSPLAKHTSLKMGKRIEIPFSQDEVKNVLTHGGFNENFEDVRNKLIIDLFYSTGIRRMELIDLEVGNVDLVGHSIKVLGKRNKERIIPLLPTIVADIVNYLDKRSDLEIINDAKLLFLTNSGNKLNISLVYRLVNKYFSTVTEKVKKSPHILRHSFATHLVNNDADLNAIKELLGHATLASTQVYTHNSLSELKRAHGLAHPRQKK